MFSFVINLASSIFGGVLLLFSTVYVSVSLQNSSNRNCSSARRGFLMFLSVVLFGFGVFLLVKGLKGSIEIYLLEGL